METNKPDSPRNSHIEQAKLELAEFIWLAVDEDKRFEIDGQRFVFAQGIKYTPEELAARYMRQLPKHFIPQKGKDK